MIHKLALYGILFALGFGVFVCLAVFISFRYEPDVIRMAYGGIFIVVGAIVVLLFTVCLASRPNDREQHGRGVLDFLCPRCETPMPWNADYCPTCGKRLTEGGGLNPPDRPPEDQS